MGECPFCSKEVIETQKVLENSHARVFYSRTPATLGTVLVVPKRHIERFEELKSEELLDIQEAVAQMARAFKEFYQVSDYVILQKNGDLAGRTVDHLHLHLVPTRIPFKEIVHEAFHYRPAISPEEMETRTSELRSFFS
ncbi:MAG: hypothetical protein SP1CHLAM54_16970 [Chlamydiia bacterium]|nr:hypothetical protein [Chlamydiia bacterium]MCH9616585.1 hypothetical protein [Chlamydiia bacterium]MCH9629315.1 hypothetical protein [Chlamydiia bacterium]